MTPNGAPVILLTIDTVRADHLSVYGYPRPTTPFLLEFSRESVVFERALAQSSWTLPSMLSLFSSLEPPALGVRDGVRPAPRKAGAKGTRRAGETEVEIFADEHLMLAEALGQAGYVTAGISTNGHLIKRQGFAQGFDWFEEERCMWGNSDCALGLALEVLSKAPSRQHFLWVHLFDPHFDKAGSPPTYVPPSALADSIGDSATNEQPASTIRDYDRKLRGVDDSLRRFFTSLSRKRDLDSFLIVIAGDHGEEFFEKGRWGHSKAVTNTLIHVPLLFRLPGRSSAGLRISEPVRLLDVAPTTLELLGLPPRPAFQGTSLSSAVCGGGSPPALSAYGETRRSGKALHYLVDPRRDVKLVMDRNSGQRRLYRFSGDPAETQDIAADHPELTEELGERVETLIDALTLEPGVTPQVRSTEALEKLEALGYLDGSQ